MDYRALSGAVSYRRRRCKLCHRHSGGKYKFPDTVPPRQVATWTLTKQPKVTKRGLISATVIHQKHLLRKHEKMKKDLFAFFRATFYRWIQVWPEVCPDLTSAPMVLAVGDLHFENFGTWRDAEDRLVWGVNDFDEAFPPALHQRSGPTRGRSATGDCRESDRPQDQRGLRGYSRWLHEGARIGRTAIRFGRGSQESPRHGVWQRAQSAPVLEEAPIRRRSEGGHSQGGQGDFRRSDAGIKITLSVLFAHFRSWKSGTASSRGGDRLFPAARSRERSKRSRRQLVHGRPWVERGSFCIQRS